MSDLLALWNPISRGKVKCSVCLTVIPKGEKYVRQKRVDAGDIWEFKTCQLCEEVFKEAIRFHPDDEITQLDIYWWAVDETDGDPHKELAKQYLDRLRTGQRK